MLAPAPKDWWLEDISDLDIDLYRRVILAIKAKGAPPELVAQSIRVYSLKCLPDMLQEFPTGNNSLITCGKSSCKFTDISNEGRACAGDYCYPPTVGERHLHL